ncbi:hypothetical protein E2320_013338 [Naja naja]|nr:hypothetical protein E2320_013338 [Naja naja]
MKRSAPTPQSMVLPGGTGPSMLFLEEVRLISEYLHILLGAPLYLSVICLNRGSNLGKSAAVPLEISRQRRGGPELRRT